MSKFSLFTQVLMIIIAVTIGIVYIKPTIASIRSTEETTAMYIAEANKVKEVDEMLEMKVRKVDSVPTADVTALNRYMPDSVDDVAVMKDISAVFTALKIPLSGLSVGGTAAPVDVKDGGLSSKLTSHTFTVSASMSYSELKKLLHALEINDYLLQVDSLRLAPTELGSLLVNLTLSTFSRAKIKSTADAVAEVSE